jgi:acyl-homoserine lactone synthase
MIHIVDAGNIARYPKEMEEAHRLRHQVFVDDLGWEGLRRDDGCEVDQFDNEHAVHMLYIHEGRVLGYQRLLQSTRPHLLSHVMPQLCETEFPVGENIWEWTRYCVQPEHRERGRKLSPIGLALLTAIVEWGMERGVDSVIIEMDPLWLLRLVQLHFRVTPLGLPERMAGRDVVAVTARFDGLTLKRLYEMAEPSALKLTA